MLAIAFACLFLGGALGYFLAVVLSTAHDAELAAMCTRCAAHHRARAMAQQARRDAGDVDLWEGEAPRREWVA